MDFSQKYWLVLRSFNVDGKIFCPTRDRGNDYFKKILNFREIASISWNCSNKVGQGLLLNEMKGYPLSDDLKHILIRSKLYS